MVYSFFTNQSIDNSNNIELPSYENPYYKLMKNKWAFVLDMYRGREAWLSINDDGYFNFDPAKISRYLPCEQDEPAEEYKKRLSRSYFERFFGTAIENFSGFLSSFILNNDVDKTILDNIDDVDLLGNNLEVFLKNADTKALRDEHCFIYVEFPKKNENIKTAYDEKIYKSRPYLVLIDCRDIVNGILSDDNKEIIQLTIKEKISVKEGKYGVNVKTRYRVLTPGHYQVFEIGGEKDNTYQVVVDEGDTSLNFIPIIPYSLFNKGSIVEYFGCDVNEESLESKPPLYDLAELNLKHYQKTSEKDEVMHRCNLPVLVINELQQTRRNANEPYPIVSLGPNTCLWNVDAKFVEPSGSALQQTQLDIEKLEKSILDRTLSFLTGNEIVRTATEVNLFSTPVESNLSAMARAKQSAVEVIFRYWAAYYKKPYGGSIKVDERILKSTMDSNTFTIIDKIYERGIITTKTYFHILQSGKILPNDFVIEDELKLVEEDRNKTIAGQNIDKLDVIDDEDNVDVSQNKNSKSVDVMVKKDAKMPMIDETKDID